MRHDFVFLEFKNLRLFAVSMIVVFIKQIFKKLKKHVIPEIQQSINFLVAEIIDSSPCKDQGQFMREW